MKPSSRDIVATEFHSGPVAAREATDATDRKFLDAILQAPSLTTLIRASHGWARRRIEFQDCQRRDVLALTSSDKESIFKSARSGDRVAAILDGDEAIAMLGAFGYVASQPGSEMPQETAAIWLEHLSKLVAPPLCAIVVGHDFDPIFLLSLPVG